MQGIIRRENSWQITRCFALSAMEFQPDYRCCQMSLCQTVVVSWLNKPKLLFITDPNVIL